MVAMIAAWWAVWDLGNASQAVRAWATSSELSVEFLVPFLFLAPPLAAVALVRLISYSLNRTFLDDRWRVGDLIRLALWSTAAPAGAQLFAAAGFEGLYQKRWAGSAGWLITATAALAVGTLCLRRAEGLKMRKVKSGEMYKRAMVLAKHLGIPLREVSVVPVGRGNLTNAWGSTGRTVAITENYTKFLSGAQLDFVIGHELGHVQQRHGIRKLGVMAAMYGVVVAGCVLLPRNLFQLRPLLDVVIVFAPVLLQRFISRRFEYAADLTGLEATHNPEMAIQALENLHRASLVPAECGWVAELFMTHPSLKRRARAINAARPMGRPEPAR
jgi:Zn-dependent protease with chaperone function